MEGPTPSYREHLVAHYERRKASRPSYSLRAFARDLGYGAPQLSRVINGKQHLSLTTARTIADHLFDSDRAREMFVAQVELESASNPAAKKTARTKLERAREREFGEETVLLQAGDFQVISDWYHLAILELLALHGAPTTPVAIGKYLGITRGDAEFALERLSRLGLIENQQGRWTKTLTRLHVPSGKANGAIRKFHRSMIEKALEAIEAQETDLRYLSGRTIGLAPKDLPKFKALVDDFLARVSVLSGESNPRSKLYHFNVQMFDLQYSKPKRASG